MFKNLKTRSVSMYASLAMPALSLKVFKPVIDNLYLLLNNRHTSCKAVVLTDFPRQFFDLAVGHGLTRFNFRGGCLCCLVVGDDNAEERQQPRNQRRNQRNNNFRHFFKSFRNNQGKSSRLEFCPSCPGLLTPCRVTL